MTRARIIALGTLVVVIVGAAWVLARGGATAEVDRARGGPGSVAEAGAARSTTSRASAASADGPGTTPSPVVATPFKGEPESQPGGTWVVTGRVVDKDNAPVVGMKVRLGIIGTNANALWYFPPAATLEATTATDGSFAFALMPPERTRGLRAEVVSDAFESDPTLVTVEADDPPPTPIVLSVQRFAGAVVGTVTDGTGRPVGGAKIASPQWTVTTGADGTYRFPTPARWPSASLTASAAGFAGQVREVQLTAGAGPATLDFTLRPQAVIEGVITRDDHSPVAGARVEGISPARIAQATTGADGTYRLDGFDADESICWVNARGDGLVAGTGRPAFVDRRARVDITLHAGAAVSGVVVAADGTGLRGAKITITSAGRDTPVSAVAGRDGRFTVDGVPTGPSVIAATLAGFAPQTQPLVAPAAGGAPIEVRLVLAVDGGHPVGGTVVDAAGKPLAHFKVDARRADGVGSHLGSATTDADGRFRIEGLPERPLIVEVYAAGWLRSSQPATVNRDDVVITLIKTARLAGLVIDAATNAPIPRFTVRMVSPPAQPGDRENEYFSGLWTRQGRQFEATDGVWHIDDAPLAAGGVVIIEVRADGYGTGTLPRVVATAEPDPKASVVALAAGASVSGVVVNARGKPLAHVALTVIGAVQRQHLAEDAYATPMADAETSDTGSFVLTGVAPGELSIFVKAPPAPPHCAGPFQVAAGAAVADLRIVVPDGGSVTGVVLGPDGAPLVGARVRIEMVPEVAGFQASSATTGRDGRFTIGGLPAGRLRVGYVEPGSWDAVLDRQITLQAGETQEVRLAFDGPCAVRVVIEGSPPPVGVCPVRVEPTAVGAGAATNTARVSRSALVQGTTVDLAGLDAGVHRVTVRGCATANSWDLVGEAQVTLVPGATTEVHVRLVQRPR